MPLLRAGELRVLERIKLFPGKLKLSWYDGVLALLGSNSPLKSSRSTRSSFHYLYKSSSSVKSLSILCIDFSTSIVHSRHTRPMDGATIYGHKSITAHNLVLFRLISHETINKIRIPESRQAFMPTEELKAIRSQVSKPSIPAATRSQDAAGVPVADVTLVYALR